jgi:hypothetical protein
VRNGLDAAPAGKAQTGGITSRYKGPIILNAVTSLKMRQIMISS